MSTVTRHTRHTRLLAACLATLSLVAPALAQPAPPAERPRHVFRTVPFAPMALPAPIPLDGGSPQGAVFQWTGLPGERIVRNVQRPQLYPVRPAPGQANGQAVLVVPGGGYKFVAIENEGLPVAQRLAEAGYAAFVLVYRVAATPADDLAFAAGVNQEIAERFSRPQAPAQDRLTHPPAVDDAKAAMRWLRANAAAWGFDAAAVGYLGFSAGARSGQQLVAQATAEEMPRTLALVYGGLGAVTPRAPVPPLFVAQAADDPLYAPTPIDIVASWRAAGQRVELHLYERGGHGFGLQQRGHTSDGWMASYLAWLARQ